MCNFIHPSDPQWHWDRDWRDSPSPRRRDSAYSATRRSRSRSPNRRRRSRSRDSARDRSRDRYRPRPSSIDSESQRRLRERSSSIVARSDTGEPPTAPRAQRSGLDQSSSFLSTTTTEASKPAPMFSRDMPPPALPTSISESKPVANTEPKPEPSPEERRKTWIARVKYVVSHLYHTKRSSFITG